MGDGRWGSTRGRAWAWVAAVAALLASSSLIEVPAGVPRALFTVGAPAIVRAAGPGGAAPILVADDVAAVVRAAAEALDDATLAVAVVDRAGTILGVYARPQADPRAFDVAVSLARTTGYFSNDQAPLSSRTVRFLSGIHYPPGVFDAPNAALYGVENTNRGCRLDDTGDAIFDTPIVRARSLAGSFGANPLPCQPDDTRGCAVGGPIRGLDGQAIWSLGITTGKRDLLDSDDGAEETVHPGGIPLYRGAQLVGGVGVAGVTRDRAEFAALVGALTAGRGLTTGIDLPNPLPPPGAIYIEGIRLPFTSASPDRRPAGSAPGRFADGVYVVPPRDGRQAPEGYLIGPRASAVPGGLDEADVRRMIDQALAQAERLRAQVRLPYGGAVPRFVIGVGDERGELLAEYRMGDSLFDAVDVVASKVRNAYYFSSREGYEVLRGAAVRAGYGWDEPPAGHGWALTNRTLSYGGQPLFPPGIERSAPKTPGPWFELFVYDTQNPCTEGPGASRGGDRSFVNQSGIAWFPGSVPLFKNGRLVGGLGAAGDGVEQDDLVAAAGGQGFEPPSELRVDNSEMRSLDGRRVRLPYLKFPRNPEQP